MPPTHKGGREDHVMWRYCCRGCARCCRLTRRSCWKRRTWPSSSTAAAGANITCAIHTPLPLRASARGGVALCAARARSEREAEIERASGQAGDREASRKGHAGGAEGRQSGRHLTRASEQIAAPGRLWCCLLPHAVHLATSCGHPAHLADAGAAPTPPHTRTHTSAITVRLPCELLVHRCDSGAATQLGRDRPTTRPAPQGERRVHTAPPALGSLRRFLGGFACLVPALRLTIELGRLGRVAGADPPHHACVVGAVCAGVCRRGRG